MDKQEIYQLIAEAKKALLPTHADPEIRKEIATVDTVVTEDANRQYQKYAKLLFSHQNITDKKKKISKDIDCSIDPEVVIKNVKSAGTKATLRKYARSVRHVAIHELHRLIKLADGAQRLGDWEKVNVIVTSSAFKTLTELSKILPADYLAERKPLDEWKPGEKYIKKDKNGDVKKNRNGNDVKPTSRPNSKKNSLSHLPNDWRELMAAKSTGKNRVPMMIAMLTGCRPAELESGVEIECVKDSLYVKIIGVKVKESAGQEYRIFKLASHPLTMELLAMMKSVNDTHVKVKVKKGNSVTTHMRSVAKKIWPKRTRSVTVYTARHAMAADCKAAIAAGDDPDLVSKVLGHIVDKTASYYGNQFQAGGKSVVPTEVMVPKPIRQKSKERNEIRKSMGLGNNLTKKSRKKNKI